MSASEYCSAADVHDVGGLPRGALPNPGRLLSSVDTSTDVLTLDGHGFGSDAPVTFRAEAGGSLPSPLVAGTTYYVIPLTDATFKVSASAGGSAVNLTTTGSNIVVIAQLPYAAAIQWGAALIDDHLIAHPVPLSPVPVTIKTVNAQLAAAYLLSYCGQPPGNMTVILTDAKKLLSAWQAGQKIRGADAPSKSANMAVAATAIAVNASGWFPSSSDGCCSGGAVP